MAGRFKNTILIGFFVLGLISWAGYADAAVDVQEIMLGIEKQLITIAEENSDCVVSISTEKTTQVVSYFRNLENEIFDEFFRNFFYGESRKGDYNKVGLGSGVIIDENGTILTNEHVIAGAEKITVTLADGREFKAIIKGTDPRLDLAVIKIEADNLSYAKLADSDEVKPGQWAVAVGNPFGFAVENPKPVVTFGVISALHRSLPRTSSRKRAYLDLIQTDAAINPGNSGGPLLNIKGEAVGINVAILSGANGSEGMGFAIPINDAKIVVNKLLKGEEIIYDLIGVKVQDINPVLADYFQLKKPNGVLILSTVKNGPAEQAGLKAEDVIIKFNNQKVINILDLIKKLQNVKTNDVLLIKVVRNSLPRTIKLKLKKSVTASKVIGQKDKSTVKKSAAAKKKKSEIIKNKKNNDNWRGLKVSAISREFADNFNLDSSNGVIVKEVISGSPAEKAGIRINDIINQVNSTVVKTIDDFKKAVFSASGNVLIKTNRGYLMVSE